MRVYWIQVTDSKKHISPLGYGVTALNEQDAKRLLFEALSFPETESKCRIRVVRDMSEVDQNHVVPNMGNHLKRGVWFPKGLEELS